jgi:hypothetical protein
MDKFLDTYDHPELNHSSLWNEADGGDTVDGWQ